MIWKLIILSLPWIVEVWIETYYEKVKKISINHPISAGVRVVFMLLISVVFQWLGVNDWWRAFILSAALHFMFFNYAYNYITGRKLTYLRSKGFDKFLSQFGWVAVLWAQIIILIGAILIYLHKPF